MAETIPGTGEDQPADDSIRASLAAAMADQPEPAEKPEPKKAAEKPAADAEPAAEVEDKPDAEATAEPDKPAKEKAAKEPAEAEDKPEPTADEKAATDKKTAVASLTGKWSAKDKEAFGKLPPEGQDLLLRRHKEMEGAFTKKTQEIAAFRKDYEPVQQVLAPYTEQMKQHGWSPSTLITAWANVEKRLMDGDGHNVVAGLMKGYKLDLAKVAEAMGLKPAARAADPAAGELPPVEVAAQAQQPSSELDRRLQAIQQRLDADDRRRAEMERAAANTAVENVMTDIEKFKTAQDDKGNLAHPHFEEVEEMMTALAQAATTARKPVPPLAQLYETAVAANPDLREQVIAARVQAQRDKEAQAARAKAEKAKKASASVTGAPGSGQAPTGRRGESLSLREQLEAAAAEAEA